MDDVQHGDLGITELDESDELTFDRYTYIRSVLIAGRIVKITVHRDFYSHLSFAVADALADNVTWSRLAESGANNWHGTTRSPSDVDRVDAELGEIAAQLIRRSGEILSARSDASARLREIIAALLVWGAKTDDGEQRITPVDIARASTRGGKLHIIEHGDGSVTVTKGHNDKCAFIASYGTEDCDRDC